MDDLKTAVKTALHIRTSTLYDSQIEDLIAEAKQELIRSGVAYDVASDENDYLIRSAVKAYCQWRMTEDEKRSEIYRESFALQQDQLRKSSGYNE